MQGRVGSPSRPKIQARMRRLKECGASRPHFSIPVGGPPYHLEAPGGADALPRNPAPSPLCSLTRALPLPRPSGQSAIALSRACPGSRLWLNLFCLGGECLKNAISLLNSPLLPSKEKAVIDFFASSSFLSGSATPQCSHHSRRTSAP